MVNCPPGVYIITICAPHLWGGGGGGGSGTQGGGRKEGKGKKVERREGGGKMGGEDKCTSCSRMCINLNSIWHRRVIKMSDLYTVIVIYRVRGTNVN
jgi:hypothetical protein